MIIKYLFIFIIKLIQLSVQTNGKNKRTLTARDAVE